MTPENDPASGQPEDLASPYAPSGGGSAQAPFSAVEYDSPPPRRWLLPLLVWLYGLSIAAAVVILLRAPSRGSDGKGFLKPAASLLSTRKDSVGWVTIGGAIYQGDSGAWGKGSTAWARRIRKLADRKEVKAIVLDINSPGGSVGAVQEIHSAVLYAREEKKKPVVAVLGDVAASGGYYVAAACDKVVAHPGTLLGSIGVIFHVSNIEGLFSKIGVRSEVIKSGKMKDIGSMTRPMTGEEKELLQALINDAYQQFLGAVSDGRKMSKESVLPLADGRIFTGAQALRLSLVDELGDSQRGLALAARLGGITGKPEVIRDVDSLSDMISLLDSRMSSLLSSETALALRLSDQIGFSGLEYRWRH